MTEWVATGLRPEGAEPRGDRTAGTAGGARVVVSGDLFAQTAADVLLDGLPPRPPVLGVATGSTPGGLYAELADRARRGEADLSSATVFALDEYVGVPASDPQSYASFVDRWVREPLGVDPRRVHVPPGDASDLDGAALAFEESLRLAGGVDVQVLGIGVNGHVAFNEPGSGFETRTRVVDLSHETRVANARFFEDVEQVPRRALTQGIATVLSAARIVVLARGAQKAEAVRAAVRGPLDVVCPASALRLHPAVTWVLDSAAASLLGASEEVQEGR